HAQRRVVLHGGVDGLLAPATHQQVDLHVHQPGQQDLIAQIDDLALGFAAHADDAVTFDPDDSGTHDFAGVDVEESGRLEGQHEGYTTGSLMSSAQAAPLS